jgi:large conductance mechanosensitive channel
VLNDFKQFLLRGNLVELAVAFVLGVAFAAVVTSLVEDIITPIIAAIGGEPDFSGLTFTVNDSEFRYGEFINSVISFVVIATAVFFLVVRPVNALMARRKTEPPVDEDVRKCPECLSEVPSAATRCPFCTAQIVPAAGATASA